MTGTSRRPLVVGTRGSALALAQTRIVCDALRARDPGLEIRVEKITTTGDACPTESLGALGRGVFVTEIETSLRAGHVDFAVHSAKDLPSVMPDDLAIAAFPPRVDARDVLVSRKGTLRELPAGARVGTSSPRRACQLRAARPDLAVLEMRGNVDTRLRKLAAGEFDAILLAAAGLIRLGRDSEATEWLDPDVIVPCVGQGALAVEARADDRATRDLLALLDDGDTRAAVESERAFLAELGAGCRAAVAAHATVVSPGELSLAAMIGAVDGRHVRATRLGTTRGGAELGRALAHELLLAGGAEFFSLSDSTLAGKRIAITRPADQSTALAALLAARGAEVVRCPTVAIAPVRASQPLDGTLAKLASFSWVVFTSANAVAATADRLAAIAGSIPATVRLAAIGGATSRALAGRLRPADFIPSRSTAEGLADEIPDVAGATILFPRGDLAPDVLPRRLRGRGAAVTEVVVYRTTTAAGSDLAGLVETDGLDAIIFASPSSIRFATGLTQAVERAGAKAPSLLCIGPTTARAARELGLAVAAEAATQTVGGIVEALERHFTLPARPSLTPAHR